MVPSIASWLLPLLEATFAGKALRVSPGGSPAAVFEAIHTEVGDIEIYDDGDELTIVLGRFTHVHFANYDEGIDDRERADRISKAVVDFLRELFDDKIELYGSHSGGGGASPLKSGRRGFLSKAFFGKKSYVWSGPLPEGT